MEGIAEPASRNGIRPGWRHWACLGLIMVVGLFARTIAIGREPLWTDEALTLVIARASWTSLLRPVDPTPWLYYSLHHWFLSGLTDPAAVRMISLAAGMATIVVVYAIGRMAIGRRGALAVAALTALSGPLVDYSQEARAYALLVLLILLAVLGLLGWFGDRRRTYWLVLFAAATMFAVSTHLVGLFWAIPAILVLLILSHHRSASDGTTARIATLGVLLACVPEFVRLWGFARSDGGGFSWLAQASAARFVSTVTELAMPAGLWANPFVERAGIAPAVQSLVIATVLGWIGWRVIAARRSLLAWGRARPEVAAVILILLTMPLAMWLFGFVSRPIFMPRTALVGVAGFVLLVGLLIEHDRSRGRVLGALFVAAYGGALLLAGTVRAKEDWGDTAQRLGQLARPGELILLCPYWQVPALQSAARKYPPLEVALIAPLVGHLMLFDHGFGADRQWDEANYTYVWAPEHAVGGARAGALFAGETELAARHIWLVSGSCQPAERRAMIDALGEGGETPVWRSRGDSGHVIRIDRFDPAAPHRLRVSLPAARR